MSVRLATHVDIPAILPLCETFWNQTDYNIPFDLESTAVTSETCIEQGLMVVLEYDGEIVGLVAGLCAPCPANHHVIVGAEIVWYVKPEYRNYGSGTALIMAIEAAAEAAGVHRWSMMSLEISEPEVANAVYEANGYRKVENAFLKELS